MTTAETTHVTPLSFSCKGAEMEVWGIEYSVIEVQRWSYRGAEMEV
jgi:hypothetical protein